MNSILFSTILMLSYAVQADNTIGEKRIEPLNIAYHMAQIKSTDLNHHAATGDGMYTIVLPGYYFLATDLLPNPTHNGVICIKIAASNVLLDFNGKTISQITTTGGATGTDLTALSIDANQSDICIKNGTITTMTGPGLVINSNDANIQLKALAITKCDNTGIIISNARNIELSDIDIKQCTGSALGATDGAVGIKITESSNITATQVKSNSHTNTTLPAIGFLIQTCAGGIFIDCAALNNIGASGIGFQVSDQSTGCQFTRCNASNNNSSTSTGYACGFYLSTADYSQLTDVLTLANSATQGTAYGIYLNNARGTILTNCSSRGTQTKDLSAHAYGYYINATNGTKIDHCSSISTITTGGNAYDYYITNGRSMVLSDCIAKDADAAAGNGNAFGFYSQNGLSNEFIRCQSIGNRGGIGQNAIGAGFALVQADYFSTIRECESLGNTCGTNANSGTAYGILLDGTTQAIINAQVKGCTLANNKGAKSYGYCDTSANSTTLLMSTISSGHGKCLPVNKDKKIIDTGANNFLFTYDNSSKNPTNIISETHVSNLQVIAASTPYMNLSITSE